MKLKKNKKSDLENKRTLFFQMGIVITLACMLVAFESGSSSLNLTDYVNNTDELWEEEEMLPITKPKIEKPIPPARPIEFIIIDDPDVIIDDPVIDFTSEIDPLAYMEYDFPEEKVKEPDPFIKVEEMPQYHGGTSLEFKNHLQSIVVYPRAAIDMGIQGKVYVNFVVDKNGKLTKPAIVRSPDELLSKAVLDALHKTDTWKPGEQRKRKVPVLFTIPIDFKLQ